MSQVVDSITTSTDDIIQTAVTISGSCGPRPFDVEVQISGSCGPRPFNVEVQSYCFLGKTYFLDFLGKLIVPTLKGSLVQLHRSEFDRSIARSIDPSTIDGSIDRRSID